MGGPLKKKDTVFNFMLILALISYTPRIFCVVGRREIRSVCTTRVPTFAVRCCQSEYHTQRLDYHLNVILLVCLGHHFVAHLLRTTEEFREFYKCSRSDMRGGIMCLSDSKMG